MLRSNRAWAILIAIAFSAGLWIEPGTGADALGITVTRFDDPALDGCAVDDCSLREAIIAANAAAGPDKIELPAGTFTLSLRGRYDDAAMYGDLDITDVLTISGASREGSIISAGGPATAIEDRVFDVQPGASADPDG